MERPRRPRVEAIVLYHASVARLKKIQGMFGIIRHNSGPGGICKLIFAVLESQNTVFFTPYHWFSPISSSQNHHTTPYQKEPRQRALLVMPVLRVVCLCVSARNGERGVTRVG
jgi:hypothetical protein